jgi:prepilin-type processing-associated H-X9-DG protein
VREAANRVSCASNLRQLALACHGYHDTHGLLPTNSFDAYGPTSRSWSWLAKLLPYLEQGTLSQQGNIPMKTLYESREVAASSVKLFLCPSDGALGSGSRIDAADLGVYDGPIFPPTIRAGQTNYKGVSGANWAWGASRWHHRGTNGEWDGLTHGDGLFYRGDSRHPKRLSTISDGTSSTFMIGEDVPAKNHWCSWPYANNAVGTCAIAPNARRDDGTEYSPRDWHNVYSFRSRHPGGLQFAHADGSVRFVPDSIDLEVYRALATVQGGEVASLP